MALCTVYLKTAIKKNDNNNINTYNFATRHNKK